MTSQVVCVCGRGWGGGWVERRGGSGCGRKTQHSPLQFTWAEVFGDHLQLCFLEARQQSPRACLFSLQAAGRPPAAAQQAASLAAAPAVGVLRAPQAWQVACRRCHSAQAMAQLARCPPRQQRAQQPRSGSSSNSSGCGQCRNTRWRLSWQGSARRRPPMTRSQVRARLASQFGRVLV